MIYNPNFYEADELSSCRFALGQTGKRNLIAVGLNPNKANLQKSDQTISKIMGFAARNGYDGFMVINLYPKRSLHPDLLAKRVNHRIFQNNLEVIKKIFQNSANIDMLACWGNTILIRSYLIKSLIEINKLSNENELKWLQIGEPTKGGHPRHPARVSYDLPLSTFDIQSYINDLKFLL